MRRIGVIDIGANSVRLLLSEINNNGYYRVLDQLNTSLRICEDLIDNNIISEEKICKTVSTLKSYKTLCDVSGVNEIFVFACDTIYRAKNKDEIISKLNKSLGATVKFLSADEECELIFKGVKSGLYLSDGLIVDIGGGSTHLIQYKNGEIANTFALPIGSVNISHMFNLKDRISKEDITECEHYLSNIISDCEWLKDCRDTTLVAVGGTVRSIAKIDRLQKHYLLDITNNYKFDDMSFLNSFNLLKIKDLKQRKKVPGLSLDRSDIIVGGSLILKHIIEAVNAFEITVSANGVREGLIESIISPSKVETDILDYSINGLIDTLNLNKKHSEQIYKLTLILFEKLKPLHHLGDSYLNSIKTAAKLHDCGISIDYYNHHRHSFYIILNSHLKGLSHKELLSAATLAAMHRNNSYSFPLPQYSFVVNKLDLVNVEKIGVLLKISEGLDRTLIGAVKDIDVVINENSVELILSSKYCLHLEIAQAMRASKSFAEVYGKELIIKTKEKAHHCCH